MSRRKPNSEVKAHEGKKDKENLVGIISLWRHLPKKEGKKKESKEEK